jgi:hypothetical protein
VLEEPESYQHKGITAIIEPPDIPDEEGGCLPINKIPFTLLLLRDAFPKLRLKAFT